MRLLLVGDMACHTGFARVNEALGHELLALGWDVHVLAVNYRGDPHPLLAHFYLYPAGVGGDALGVRRIRDIVEQVEPDVILAVNDPWVVTQYLAALRGTDHPPIVAYMPVDGTGLRRRHVEPLNGLVAAVAYTEFGLTELRRAGLETEAAVIPHGIDLDLFRPIDHHEACAAIGLDSDTYAVLVLDANQARKRLDIAFEAFARFAEGKPDTVKLVYHGSLAGEVRNGWAIEDMAADLGIGERLILTAPDIRPNRGVASHELRLIYSMCRVKLSTTSGEGWGLSTMEAMACGVPCIAPRFSALGEWTEDAALMVECKASTRHAGGINTVGRVPLAEDVAAALDDLYHYPQLAGGYRERGLALVAQERFRWGVIARQFDGVLRAAVEAGVLV